MGPAVCLTERVCRLHFDIIDFSRKIPASLKYRQRLLRLSLRDASRCPAPRVRPRFSGCSAARSVKDDGSTLPWHSCPVLVKGWKRHRMNVLGAQRWKAARNKCLVRVGGSSHHSPPLPQCYGGAWPRLTNRELEKRFGERLKRRRLWRKPVFQFLTVSASCPSFRRKTAMLVGLPSAGAAGGNLVPDAVIRAAAATTTLCSPGRWWGRLSASGARAWSVLTGDYVVNPWDVEYRQLFIPEDDAVVV